MQRIQDIMGLPVIDIHSGKELGQVHDILWDQEWNLIGILLQPKGILRDGRYIPSEAFYSIGKDCVMIHKPQILSLDNKDQAVITMISGPASIKGKTVISSEGYQLGQLEDVYMEEDLGKITGYEVSEGFLTDVIEGRKIIQTSESIILGENALIVNGPISCEID